MGMGIAQIAATKGHKVCLYDNYDGAIENANKKIKKILNRLVEKKRITDLEKKEIINRIHFSTKLDEIQKSNMSKLGADGKPIYRKDGKVMKGPNYFKPNFSKFFSWF